MIDEHLGYLSDGKRQEIFRAAIEKAVFPGARVLDLGCGTGILGLLCLRQGAGFVEAIEEAAIIEAARRSFQRAGLGDQVRWHHNNSFRVSLADPVDIIVCDHIGYFGFDYGLLKILSDASRRFLVDGGCVIPKRLELFIGLVDEKPVTAKVEKWLSPSFPDEFLWMRSLMVNRKIAAILRSGDLLSSPALLQRINLGESAPQNLSWTAMFEADRDGSVGGLSGWFRAELVDDIWMTNAPGDTEAIYRPQALLPFDKPIRVKRGDQISATIMARPDEQLIAWRVNNCTSGQGCEHSTLAGRLIGPEVLRRKRPDFRPQPSASSRARSIILGYCDGHRSVRDVESCVLREHPDLFPSVAELRSFVSLTIDQETE